MIHRMGDDNGVAGDGTQALWWVFGGTVATITLYQLLKGSPVSQEAFVHTEEPTFSDMNSVAVRFGQIRDLWSMGYLNSAETVSQLENLTLGIQKLQDEGKASAGSVQELTNRISRLIRDVQDYQASAA